MMTRNTAPLWRVTGISRNGKPYIMKVRASDHDEASRKARPHPEMQVVSVVLDTTETHPPKLCGH
jgi:hypothetical protein